MHQLEFIILTVAIILLYIQPYALIRFTNTFFGRLISLIILVLASLHSTLSGIVVAMVIVVFTDTIYEGMDTIQGTVTNELLESTTDKNTYNVNEIENSKSGSSIIGDAPGKPVGSAVTDLKGSSLSSITFSNIPSTANFRKNHCRTKPGSSTKIFVDEKGKELKMADIKKKYPLNFTNGDQCNPCDETCSYTITDSVEQLHNEENLRSKQASTFL
jgi:hypothetical protein